MEKAEHSDESLGGSLPELRELCLQNLDSFTSIIDLNNVRGRIIKCSLLNHLKVCNCNQLKYLFPLYVLKDLQQLKTIVISDCKQLEHVFVDEKQDTQTTSSNVKEEALHILFSLKLTNLPELSSITSGDVQLISRSLTEMTVENCPKFVFAFAYNLRSSEEQGRSPEKKPKEMIVTPSKLKYLDLRQVDHLEKICMYKDLLLSFMPLTSLQLWNCNKLEYLFSLSMAKDLSSLQEPKIISCEKIEQIVRKETEEMSITVELPQVEALILEQLPKFTGSSSLNSSSVKWLALTMVKVDGCPKIKKSMLGTVDRPLLNRVHVSNCQPWESGDRESNINYLFDLTDELSKIEQLKIEDSKGLKKYMEMELQESSFTQLKAVEVLQCDNELNKFLFILLYRSNKLEELRIEKCEPLEQVFDLKIFVVDKQMGLRFPNLKTMQLLCLPNLKFIWNNDPMGVLELGKLVKLEMIKCGLLKTAFSLVLVQKLVLLEVLKIESCKMIEHVVKDDKEIHDLLFPNLKDLQLASLPELTKFYSGHRNFIFPNLQCLRIEKCPKLNVLSTQMVTINEGTSDHHVLPNEMMHPCPKLQKLKLADLEMLEDISQGKYSCIPLCDLQAMEVDSFSRLSDMWIAGSGSLVTLVVRNCNSLRRLVLPSNCFDLKKIEISSCKILEEISTNPKQQKEDKKIFHNLESIILENLEKLSSFNLDTHEFSSLQKLRIVNCPTLETLPRNNYTKEDNALNKHSTFVLFDDKMEDSQAGEGKMKMPPQLESLELADYPICDSGSRNLRFQCSKM